MSDVRPLPPWPEIEGAGLALLERLTAVSSPSGDASGLRRMADILGAELEARGLSTEIEEETDAHGEAQPLLVARSAAGSAAAPLLLLGHLDTVLPAAPAHRDGDRLFATGANDMKGGFAAFLLALDLLRQRGQPTPGDLELVGVPDEETGGAITERVTRRRGAAAREIWVLEPGEATAAGETIVAGRRGLFHWHFTAHGRSAHSGLHFWQGRSALLAAADFARAAGALSLAGRGPTINPARLVAGSAELLANLSGLGGELLGTARQVNVVPDEAGLDGEARFLRATEAEPLRARLFELADEIGKRHEVSTELTLSEVVPPFDPGGPQRALGEQAVALAAARGWSLTVETERGGISFPNYLAAPERVPVLDGLGPVGGGMHTRDEHVSLRSLARRGVLVADLLAQRG